jgi:hypothetical protein
MARSELMPGTWSAESSRSCQFRGASSSFVGGTTVDTDTGAGAGAVEGARAGAGAVAGVAVVDGAPHAAATNARRTSADTGFLGGLANTCFIGDLTVGIIREA